MPGEWRLALGSDPGLAENNQRVKARERILPEVRARFAGMDRETLVVELEAIGLPFAPILRPDELLDDPHLRHEGGMVDVVLPGGVEVRLPALPVEIGGPRKARRAQVPEIDADRVGLLGE